MAPCVTLSPSMSPTTSGPPKVCPASENPWNLVAYVTLGESVLVIILLLIYIYRNRKNLKSSQNSASGVLTKIESKRQFESSNYDDDVELMIKGT